MIWFILMQFICFAIVIGLWYTFYKFLHKKEYEETFMEFLFGRIKKVLITLLVGFCALTIFLYQPLYNTAKCSIHGTSMNANTKYSWVMGECLMETKNKSWIPVKISRGVPDGADDTNHDGYPDQG